MIFPYKKNKLVFQGIFPGVLKGTVFTKIVFVAYTEGKHAFEHRQPL